MMEHLQVKSTEVLRYIDVYEELFTQRSFKLKEEPLIYLKEGNHKVTIEVENEELKNKGEGLYSFNVNSTLLINKNGISSVILSYEDINNIIKLREDLFKMENLAASGEITAATVHELKNPLFSIRGFTQLLEKRLDLDDKGREYIKIIISELDRMNQLLEDFLSLFKKHNKIKEILYIDELLEETLSILKPKIDKHKITCYLNVHEDLLPLFGYKDLIKQVFLNIILNAIDILDKNGKISIEAYSKNNSIFIEFQDNGPGISKTALNQIFDPFFTTKKNGTGLGLYISNKIIKSHGGKIICETEKDLGTKIIIELPSISN